MSVTDEAEALARELFEARSKLRATGRALHDHIGPLLSAAGIRLDLLRADHPEATLAAGEALVPLEEAMERVRALSRELNPPPAAHLGLKKALSSLLEKQKFSGEILFLYEASVSLPEEVVAGIYEAAAAVLERAIPDPSASQISLAVRGERNLTVTIESNGRVRMSSATLAALNRRGRPAGIILAAPTKKGTIVSIRYAARRPAR